MSRRARWVLWSAVAAVTAGGCAHGRRGDGGRTAVGEPPRTHGPATRAVEAVDPKATLALDAIEPRPVLPQPSTRPKSSDAPVEALVLYAQARAALADNQRFTAINLLQKAVAADPNSADPYVLLADAHVAGGAFNDKAIEALQTAADLRPDDLSVQLELGRQHAAKGDAVKAIHHLRLARLTSGYTKSPADAASVDFSLARTLRQAGYDRAALALYQSVGDRLKQHQFEMRGDRELQVLLANPQILLVEVGELYEKHGQYADAIEAFRPAAERDPGNFDLQAKLVRLRGAAGQRDAAVATAADLVAKFRASPDSLALLREACAAAGVDVVAQLRALQKARPEDRAILFALSDVLRENGRVTDATDLLTQALGREAADVEVTRRLFNVYTERNDVAGAAKLLIESLARQPDAVRELSPMWAELMRPSRKNRLRIAAVQRLDVSPAAEAARQYWVSRMAELWRRDALAKSALRHAVDHDPPFRPAYRVLLSVLWNEPDHSAAQKVEESEALASRAESGGDAGLAAELRGLSLLNQKRPRDALAAFAQAAKRENTSPDLQLVQAVASDQQGFSSRAEQILWKLIGDRPTYEDAYAALFRHYLDQQQVQRALKVLNTWLGADPGSVNARLLQATLYQQGGRAEAAEDQLLKLFAEHPDSPEVLRGLFQLYGRTGRTDKFVGMLEDRVAKRPDDRAAVEFLVEVYANQRRAADASRVLDAARRAVATDPDLLYYVANLYTRVGQRDMTEQALEQVLALDPRHAAASNDLGYFWADDGKHLDRAEQLIRVAVAEEPDNQSFLDSLGWVLYKRAKFAEAKTYFDRAIGPAALPDPIVLDHLGDVLYQLDRHAEARKTWEWSLQRLGEEEADRDDLRELRLKLRQKLKQLDAKQPVTVAPIATTQPAADGRAVAGD
ncbi:MAG TPA: tetratricopeptide repeat protein [Tepidisphaeraceae bacterium]|nr:tetratricopeptide repeat protein [Tepidisphaeraceae bacterium]